MSKAQAQASSFANSKNTTVTSDHVDITTAVNVTQTRIKGDYHHYGAPAELSPSFHLDSILRPEPNCSFNCVDIPSCFPDTRSEIFEELDHWIRSDDKHPICWLTGPMGSGKTSIAQTLAQIHSEHHTLAANFFFDRVKRYKIAPLVRSLTRSMCALHKAARAQVREALQDDPTILDDSTTRHHQFRKLLLDIFPTVLQAVLKEEKTKLFFWRKTRLVVVIDGIDGCQDRREMKKFVELLVNISARSDDLSNVCILLTGRIGSHFKQISNSPVFLQVVKLINLQDIDSTKDIQKYLGHRLSEISDQNSTASFTRQRSQSSVEQLRFLVALSKGSFHFAQTILQYLDHEDSSRRLSSLLTSPNSLFTEVLNHHAVGRVPSHSMEVLGAITYLNSPLSVHALCKIFMSRKINPLPSLYHLSPLLFVPFDDVQPIQPICTSLWDYLKASRDLEGYRFDGLKTHFSHAASCLEIVAQLSNEESTNLGWVQYAEVQQYASVHWFSHLFKSIKISRSGRLKEFADLVRTSDVLEKNISILLDSSNSSFVLWTNILIFKIDNTKKMLEDMKQLNMIMKDIGCSQILTQNMLELTEKLKDDIEEWNENIKNLAKRTHAGFGSYAFGTSLPKPNTLASSFTLSIPTWANRIICSRRILESGDINNKKCRGDMHQQYQGHQLQAQRFLFSLH